MPKKETIPSLKKKLDKLFSKYIRMRDAFITTSTIDRAKCITCGKEYPIKSMDAGHFVGRGAGGTRYDELNVHAQCKRCNMGGNPTMHHDYELKLIEKYGKDIVEELIFLGKQPHKFTKEWLREKIECYKDDIKFMEKQR